MSEQTRHSVDPKHVIKRQGKDMVLYVGLLDAAHRAGLAGIETEILQYPAEANGQTTIARARVRLWVDFPKSSGYREFTGIGDANPKNVGSTIVPHCIRMAETRAKARALRDALNVGMVTVEELGLTPEEDDDGNAASKPARPTGQQRYDHARQHGKDPATNDAPLWNEIEEAMEDDFRRSVQRAGGFTSAPQRDGTAPARVATPPAAHNGAQREPAPNAVKIPCAECTHAGTCRTEGYCQAAAVRQSKAAPKPPPPPGPGCNPDDLARSVDAAWREFLGGKSAEKAKAPLRLLWLQGTQRDREYIENEQRQMDEQEASRAAALGQPAPAEVR